MEKVEESIELQGEEGEDINGSNAIIFGEEKGFPGYLGFTIMSYFSLFPVSLFLTLLGSLFVGFPILMLVNLEYTLDIVQSGTIVFTIGVIFTLIIYFFSMGERFNWYREIFIISDGKVYRAIDTFTNNGYQVIYSFEASNVKNLETLNDKVVFEIKNKNIDFTIELPPDEDPVDIQDKLYSID